MRTRAWVCRDGGRRMAAGVAACGSTRPAGQAASAKTTPPAEKPVRVAVIMASLGNDFYIAQKAGAEEEAAQLPGADVTISAGSRAGLDGRRRRPDRERDRQATSTRSPSTAPTPSRCCPR